MPGVEGIKNQYPTVTNLTNLRLPGYGWKDPLHFHTSTLYVFVFGKCGSVKVILGTTL